MVYRRKTNRKTFRKKRVYKKRNYKKRAANESVLCSRTEIAFDVEGPIGVSQFTTNGLAYSLNQMPSYTNMALLYDQYRIVQIKEEFTLQSDFQTLGQSGAIPLFWYVIDHDDNVPISTLQRILNEPRAVVKPLRLNQSVTFRPRLDAHVGNVASAGIIQKSMWLDTDDPDAAHYGFKHGLIGDGTYAYGYKLMRRTTWTVEFRHPKSV